jgi:2-polyprenyl-6-methoxyphenol hydroxylase-like FAD-dependent oxidoreductase
MLLYRTAIERLGAGAVLAGHRVEGYRSEAEGVVVRLRAADGTQTETRAKLLIGADGLHSTVRAQMHPQQPPIHWGGALMWRGMTPGSPIRSGASFVGLGTHRQRVVFYPISHPDPATGLATINWIAEITIDNSRGLGDGDWNKKVAIDSFIHHFEGWRYDWLDVPAMLRGADEVFEYPMIDRDPVPTWVDGRVALLGDAAHVMYPTGSNGASQAIVDARVLGAAMLEHGVTSEALRAYDRKLCAEISAVVLRNRGAGPFGLLNLLDERCGGVFDDIDAVIPAEERDEFMSRYRSAAGFAMDRLNAAPSIIARGARVAGSATTPAVERGGNYLGFPVAKTVPGSP